MYFLIVYDRAQKKLLRCDEYPLSDKDKVWKERFEIEKYNFANGKEYIEAVLFEADSLDTLKHTHSRYFNDFKGVKKRIIESKIFSRIKKEIKECNLFLEKHQRA